MLIQIKKFLNYDCYKIYQSEKEIEVYPIEKEIVNPALSVQIKWNTEYEISVKSRNDKRIITKSKQKNFSIAAMIILCKKYFEHPKNDVDTINKLKNLIEQSNLEDANKLLEEKLDKKFYSITENIEKDFSKICMAIKGDKVDIVFHKKYILRDISVSRAYIVLYNYAKLLENFDKWFYILNKELPINDKYDALAELYIF